MVPALPAAKVPSARRGAAVATWVVTGVGADELDAGTAEAGEGSATLDATAVLPVTSTAFVGTTDVVDTASARALAGGAAEVGEGAAARSTTAFTMAAALPTTNNEHTDAMVATLTFIRTKGYDWTHQRSANGLPRNVKECSSAAQSLHESSRVRAPSGQNGTVRILLVEDDRSIAESVTEGLVANAFVVTHVSTGADALAATDHDLILLDLGLPDMDGRDVCRQLRKRTKAPIIMLTARAEEFDRILGLEMGADDYVTKPFSFRELVARIRAVARRTIDSGQPVEEASPVLTIAPMRIDRRSRRVFLHEQELQLTAKEFDLLVFLATDLGAVRTRTEILESVWDAHWYGPTKTVDAHVASLRRKLGSNDWIQAVRGVGFRLETPA